jgi:hypothetical protein
VSGVKAPGLTWEWHPKLHDWNMVEEDGIPRVAVKCVDMWRNTNGEGSLLGQY